MTRQEVRVFLQDWFCGCGSPEDAVGALRDILALHPLYENRQAFERLVPNEGIQYLLLYTLAEKDLTEHGGSVGGGWLTDKGKALLDALNSEAADGFEALMSQCCVHGYAVEGDELLQCSECGQMNRSTRVENPDQDR